MIKNYSFLGLALIPIYLHSAPVQARQQVEIGTPTIAIETVLPIEDQLHEQTPIAVKEMVQTAPTVSVDGGSAKENIYKHESGGSLTARNSGGCLGLGQACPGSKLINACPNWETDYACQDAFFSNYAISRYGSWEGAWAKWQTQSWW